MMKLLLSGSVLCTLGASLCCQTGAGQERSAMPNLACKGTLPAGFSPKEWSSVLEVFEANLHAAVPIDEGRLQAANPGQDWETEFDGRGFLIKPNGDTRRWSWGLELDSYGFEGHETDVEGRPAIQSARGRVTYAWNADLKEWYINDKRGLEHGYTLAQRPKGSDGENSPLQFMLSVRGDLIPRIHPDGRGVDFRSATGTSVLSYSGLVVYDTIGVSYPARFETDPEGLLLIIEEAGAKYPLTIDPIAQQEAYLKASGSDLEESFGNSIASSGDTLVVGAPGRLAPVTSSGLVYVFIRNGDTWEQQACLKASNSARGDSFGISVSISGETLVVGAHREDSNATGIDGDQSDNSITAAGAAYVFVRSGNTWAQQAYIKSSNPGAQDFFGFPVAISGDTLAVGAFAEDSSSTGVGGDPNDNGLSSSGAVFVFSRSGNTWSQEAYLKASNPDLFDRFGYPIGLAGDTLVVGAVGEDSSARGIEGDQNDNNALDSGAAYVFVRSGTTWAQQAYLKSSNSGTNDLFCSAVAISGDTLVVGATGEDSNATGIDGDQNNSDASSSGAVYMFVRSGTTWMQEAYIKASNSEIFDRFGSSVAITNDALVVGAIGESSHVRGIGGDQNDNSASSAGAAFVFLRNGNSLVQQFYIKASNTNAFDNFGSSVTISGDIAAVAAAREASNARGINGNQGDNSSLDSGAVYAFNLDVGPSSRFRNLGSNPESLQVTTPRLGGTFTASVDLAGTSGHTTAILIAFLSPLELVLSGGQVFLVNLNDPAGNLFQSLFSPQMGPLAIFQTTLPNDISLVGLTPSLQAVHLGGVIPFALSNAQDLVLDF